MSGYLDLLGALAALGCLAASLSTDDGISYRLLGAAFAIQSCRLIAREIRELRH